MGKNKQREHPHHKSGELSVFWVPADPELKPEYKTVSQDLPGLKSLVGGWIEVVHTDLMPVLHCGCRVAMVVNEDGRAMQLSHNPRAQEFYPFDLIVGDVFIVGEGPVKDSDGFVDRDFFSLPPEFNDWEGPGYPYPEASRVALQNKV